MNEIKCKASLSILLLFATRLINSNDGVAQTSDSFNYKNQNINFDYSKSHVRLAKLNILVI